MWAVVIVVGAPCRDDAAGMAQGREQVFVEALLAHPPVEAFHQTILHGLAWCDVMPTNFAVFLPFEYRVGCQLGAVVRDHQARIYSLGLFVSVVRVFRNAEAFS